MKKFRFGLPVEISGKTYYIDINREKGLLDRIQDTYGKILAAAQNGVTENGESVDDFMVEKTRELIDLILGGGSFDEIFQNRVLTNYDMMSTLQYLTDEASREGRRIMRQRKLAERQTKTAP